MENQNWLESMNHQLLVTQLQNTNQYTQRYGLALSQEDTELLIAEKTNILKAERRIEFGQSILPQIIFTFCDSSFILQQNYLPSLIRLQAIFFLFKNEMMDEISDEELLNFMKEQFENVCYGDFDYLETTCLEIFSEAIRAGYKEYIHSNGKGEFAKMDIVTRWDKDLFYQALENMND